ncbi:hypothetical protein SAMN05421852_101191 [Thermoflavimicrobium dichotomicum]|uniref:Uncharacterized protein n=1 Tax=Thermoflavimicrobium dichotomicum TaxID=46223 RepID=A0A1I3JSJ0_9BACL|nr:hypothetical protein SAMN05421852_101191 [Thermoflavimicrobium dichotomicum]
MSSREIGCFAGPSVSVFDGKSPAHHKAKITPMVEEVQGYTLIIIEDMINTDGTIVNLLQIPFPFNLNILFVLPFYR